MTQGPVKLNGAAVRAYRLRLRWSQAELADQAEISVRHVVNIERYDAQPSIDLVGRVAAALGTGLDVLMCPVGEQATAPMWLRELPQRGGRPGRHRRPESAAGDAGPREPVAGRVRPPVPRTTSTPPGRTAG